MPNFDLSLLLKVMPRTEMVAALKRTATAILDQGGVIRNMENLGLKPTPFKISAHNARHKEAHYFVFNFDMKHDVKSALHDNYLLDVDIVRARIIFRNNLSLRLKEKEPCNLHIDLLPPPYRPSVQEIVEKGKKRMKPKFKYNSGMDYYPFQR